MSSEVELKQAVMTGKKQDLIVSSVSAVLTIAHSIVNAATRLLNFIWDMVTGQTIIAARKTLPKQGTGYASISPARATSKDILNCWNGWKQTLNYS